MVVNKAMGFGFAPSEPTTTNAEEQKSNFKRILDVLTIMEKNYVILQFTEDDYEAHLSPFLTDILDVGVQNQFRFAFSQFMPIKTTFKKISSKITSNFSLFQKISESIVTRHFPTWTQFQRTKKRSTSNAKNTIVVCNTQNQTKTIQWELLYRGSENSFSAFAFHQLCDGKGPTITLLNANGRVAAAYNSEVWESGDINKQNPHGFIMKVDIAGVEVFTTRFDVSNDGGTDNYSNWGPSFGAGDLDDLGIADKCNENEKSCSNLGFGYKGPGASETTLFGSRIFKVEEYEVFSVKFLNKY